MIVSKYVVIFALLGSTVLSVDLYLTHQQSTIPTYCNQLVEQDSILPKTNVTAVSSRSDLSNSLSESSLQHALEKKLEQQLVGITSTQLTQQTQCVPQSEHSVSWMDWVFSWQDSPTFHYLDLLELLSSGDSHGNAGQTSPVKS